MTSFMLVWFIFHYIPSIYTCHWHGALFMVLLLQLRCHFREFKCWISNIQSRQMYQGYRYSKLISTASKLRASGIIFVYSPSQWETTLQYNVVSNLLDTYIKSSLGLVPFHRVYLTFSQFCRDLRRISRKSYTTTGHPLSFIHYLQRQESHPEVTQ